MTGIIPLLKAKNQVKLCVFISFSLIFDRVVLIFIQNLVLDVILKTILRFYVRIKCLRNDKFFSTKKYFDVINVFLVIFWSINIYQ